ncbi:MAG: hypothetical protein COA79_12440 [Planctomycetota bacterium]|nr:MAG: hypothetical protein COA79_12440 [Planctomycetota bacterium]
MPINFQFDQKEDLVRSEARGLLSGTEIIDHLRDVSEERDIQGHFSEIVDMSFVEDLELKYSDSVHLAALVELWQIKGHSLSVFWADNQRAKEITEFMLPLLRKIGINVQICSTEKEAIEFLGFLQQYAS